MSRALAKYVGGKYDITMRADWDSLSVPTRNCLGGMLGPEAYYEGVYAASLFEGIHNGYRLIPERDYLDYEEGALGLLCEAALHYQNYS